MALTVVIFAAFLAISQAAVVHQTPVVQAVVDTQYDHNPQYTYAYDVQDPITGDSKSQVESRSGDVVQGQYSLNDPDGTRRIVDYTADPINGFNAIVKKSPLVHAVATPIVHSTPVVSSEKIVAGVANPVVAKVAGNVNAITYSAPVVSRVDNVAYAAPVSHVAYTAPVAQNVIEKIVEAPVSYSAYAYPYSYNVPYVKAHYY